MAKIKPDGVVEHLSYQVQMAMKDALKELKIENVTEKDLYRAFLKSLKLRCQSWENVPESLVDTY